MFLIDDDFISRPDVVAVQSFVGISHFLKSLEVTQILIDVEQTHLGSRNTYNSLQSRLQVDYSSRMFRNGGMYDLLLVHYLFALPVDIHSPLFTCFAVRESNFNSSLRSQVNVDQWI